MRHTHKTALSLALLCVIIGVVFGGIIYFYLFMPQFHPEKTAYIYIDTDDTVDSVYVKLTEVGNVGHMQGLKWLITYKHYDQHIHTGRYAIRPGDNAYRLYERLSTGKQTPVHLTINSVRSVNRLARQIGRQLMTDSTQIATLMADTAFIDSLGFNALTLPAFFIPNTYDVYWNVTPRHLFNRLKNEYQKFWNDERLQQAEIIGLSPVQVSILASIVDEETNAADEKAAVAGLYLNRLKRGMLLQADPTVKFALHNFELRRILHEHLSTDSPYNTYKYKGLPPGPIRIPSIAGIEAVLHAETHNYLYMTAKEDFSGRHNFAVTLAEHQKNADKYHKALNKRKIFN